MGRSKARRERDRKARLEADEVAKKAIENQKQQKEKNDG